MAYIGSNSDTFRSLEALVDANGLSTVLLALVDICNLKVEHIKTNWQDRELAKLWSKARHAIERAITTTDKLP